MKKVLIITYYWPPAGGPGVQRVLKFAKYLPEFGWQPIILTVKNGEYPAHDESLFSDIPKECKVYKTPAIEPFSLYKKFTGMSSDEAIPVAALTEQKISWKKKLAHWIRLNLFIPDARIGWIPFAVKAGKHIIENEKPDIIFSSSPPPTVHLIAQKLAKWSGIKWVADFRDPWTEIYHQDLIKKNKFAHYIDQKLEKKILTNASRISTVSMHIADSFQKKLIRFKKFFVIANGYDDADFISNTVNKFDKFTSTVSMHIADSFQKKLMRFKKFLVIANGYDDADFISNTVNKFDKFTIAYAGKINHQQNPEVLWKICAEIINKNNEFRNNFNILLMGNITQLVHSSLRNNNLSKYTTYLGYVKHKKALEMLKRSTLLLLLIPNTRKNRGIVTGKLFEYLAMNNFILGFGPPDGDAAHILNTTGTGKMFEYSDGEVVQNLISDLFKKWKKNTSIPLNSHNITQFSRKNLTKKLVHTFKNLA